MGSRGRVGSLYGQQPELFDTLAQVPDAPLPPVRLHPAHNLLAILEDCHNYIYANEGLLKERVFYEMVKIIALKIYDEKASEDSSKHLFWITRAEYETLRLGGTPEFLARIDHLYECLREEMKPLISDPRIGLKPLTLAYVVNALQNISLEATPVDVKGEAFQVFVHRHQRGGRGEFFTPQPIMEMAVEMLEPSPRHCIVDPACGSGGFLLQAANFVSRKYGVDRAEYLRHQVHGIEFNPDVAFIASIRMRLEGAEGREILCANALLPSLRKTHAEAYDMVITNPPFGSRGKIDDPALLKEYELAYRWAQGGERGSRQGGQIAPRPPEVLFIEQCIHFLKPGGYLAIVLPEGILQNATALPVRRWLRSKAELVAVVSIPQEAFVPYGTGVKTSLVIAQKHPSAVASVFMAEVKQIGYTVKGAPVYQYDEAGKPKTDSEGRPLPQSDVPAVVQSFQAFKKENSSSHGFPWFTVDLQNLNDRFDVLHYSPDKIASLSILSSYPVQPLGEIAEIVRERAYFTESPIRYIAISDVDPKTMSVISVQILESHAVPSRAKYRLQAGDIITAIAGASTGTTNHATALITEDEAGAICSNGFAVLRHFRGVDPFYLLAYLRTQHFLNQVRRLLTGHAIPALSLEALAGVLVPVPPETIQKQIGEAMRQAYEQHQQARKSIDRVTHMVEQYLDHAPNFS